MHLLGADLAARSLSVQFAQRPFGRFGLRAPARESRGRGGGSALRAATSSRRRLASSGPHRLASRALSAGSSSNSRAMATVDVARFRPSRRRARRVTGRSAPAFGRLKSPAQRVRPRLGDHDIHEALQERGGSAEIDPAVALGAPRELAGIFLRVPLDQHPLHGADQGAAECQALRIEQLPAAAPAAAA